MKNKSVGRVILNTIKEKWMLTALQQRGKMLYFLVYSAANFELRLSKDFLHCLTSNVSKSLSLNASRSL